MRLLVFLDFDDVPAVHRKQNGKNVVFAYEDEALDDLPELWEWYFHYSTRANLLALHDEFVPEYIICSSWTSLMSREQICEVLRRSNLDCVAENLHIKWRTPYADNSYRLTGIEAWLDAHNLATPRPYVIVQDESPVGAFDQLPGQRLRECAYQLDELLLAAICAVISGAESWTTVVEWSEMKLDWLRQHLPFVNGVAPHETFGRFFSLLDATQFETYFVRWMSVMCPTLDGHHIAVDGKGVGRTDDGKSSAIHLVSAWSSASGLRLGRVRTAETSAEIAAIQEFLAALEFNGAIITIDDIGSQHEIAADIVARDANYVLDVSDNQSGLAEAIKRWFDDADAGKIDRPFWDHIQTEKDHTRIETRRCRVTNDVDRLGPKNLHWAGLQSLIMIESTRELIDREGGCTANVERQYYASSLSAKAAHLAHTLRAKWGTENCMHWMLDVAFREDDSRIRVGAAAQNFAILRRIALNLLKNEKTTKLEIASKRLKAGWCTDYLAKVLGLRT